MTLAGILKAVAAILGLLAGFRALVLMRRSGQTRFLSLPGENAKRIALVVLFHALLYVLAIVDLSLRETPERQTITWSALGALAFLIHIHVLRCLTGRSARGSQQRRGKHE